MQYNQAKVDALLTTPRDISDGRFDKFHLATDSIKDWLLSFIGMGNATPKDEVKKLPATTPISAIGIVQNSSMFGVAVFAKDAKLQKDWQTIVKVAGHLASYREQEYSSDYKIAHIQDRLNDEGNYFDAESLDPTVTGGVQGLYWRVSDTADNIPVGFNRREDPLFAFVTSDSENTYLNLMEADYYDKYLK